MRGGWWGVTVESTLDQRMNRKRKSLNRNSGGNAASREFTLPWLISFALMQSATQCTAAVHMML
jgi:hypothetical protein